MQHLRVVSQYCFVISIKDVQEISKGSYGINVYCMSPKNNFIVLVVYLICCYICLDEWWCVSSAQPFFCFPFITASYSAIVPYSMIELYSRDRNGVGVAHEKTSPKKQPHFSLTMMKQHWLDKTKPKQAFRSIRNASTSCYEFKKQVNGIF